MRRTLTLTAIVLLLLSVVGMTTLQASSAYADPQFDAQWKQGEAITPNFWGPLANAKDVPPEQDKEATGGTRTVQYFDKGRMELTNGKVTNGLLATELVRGQIQAGDATFTPQAPPAIPIAGDPDNPGPTYATLATKAVSLLTASTAKTGSPVSTTVSATGDVTNPTGTAAPETTISAFDDTTKHNVPKVFADYRTKAGLQTIGFGISEPFMATVKVAGTQKPVMIQVFERRVLTYTASNDPAFRVEMGNIGQHYYQWRYPSGAQAAPAASSAAASPSGVAGSKAVPTAASAPSTGGFGVTLSDIVPTVKVGAIQTVNVTTNAKVGCAIDVTYTGNIPAKPLGLQPKQTDDKGKAGWTWAIGSEAKPGNATFTVTCVPFGGTSVGTANGSFTVSG
ncbi:MAG: hypothetical protein ACR2JW_18995 [Thermomicrobiales bacterium]